MSAVQHLRGALIEAYQAVGVDSESPREAARTLGIDKNLTWKLGRIINEDAIERVASSIPGASAVQKVVDAFSRANLNPDLVTRVSDAFQEFDEMVEIHTGDREALGLLLDSMAFSGADRLVKSRKLAFKGNSGIWGAQSRVRMNTSFIAPNKKNPAFLDYAQIGGYMDLQRLRVNGAWPLFRMRYFNDDGSDVANRMSSLVEDFDPETPHLLNDFASGTTPQIETKDISSGLVYELSEGPVGRTGLCSLFYGYSDEASLSRYRDEHNLLGEVLCLINLPIETLLMDLIVHRDVAEKIDPEAIVYGRAFGGLNDHERRDKRLELPMSESLKYLGANPSFATPHIPRYNELTSLVFDRCGFDSS
ncbi:MAG: hypothetical protein P1U42_12755, partial [Phycisphaerales bacterium]|nr:hypothetical protein [Phycisphaerales bacterium]